MVVTPENEVHVLWDDEFDGPQYTKRVDNEWTEPKAVTTPFTEFTPLLVTDGLGFVHAFWTNEDNVLFYSYTMVDRIENSAWESPLALAESALDFQVTVDSNNGLHLAYVRALSSEEFPSGVYYRSSQGAGKGWSTAKLLYPSLYYRTLLPEDTHVDVSATFVGEDLHVYVTWDNPPRSRVFLARSVDGGQTWSEPFEVDKPDPLIGISNPSHLVVYASENDVLVIWQVGDSGTGCSNYYQWSTDGGENWQLEQQIFEGLLGCTSGIDFFEKDGEPLLYISAIQPYLQIWDGTNWSDPQEQSQLTSFVDQDTQQFKELACQKEEFINDRDLFAIGCDNEEGGDIWFMQRAVDDVSDWFPEDPVWNPLTSVATVNTSINDPVLVTGIENLVHMFWVQSDGTQAGETSGTINYADGRAAGSYRKPYPFWQARTTSTSSHRQRLIRAATCS